MPEPLKIRKLSALHVLYASYALSCVSDRFWQFLLVFPFHELGGIQLVTLNQLVQGLMGMATTGLVGNWLDQRNRHRGAQTILAVSNLAMVLCIASLVVCLHLRSTAPSLYGPCLALAILFSVTTAVAFRGKKVIFTSDWVVVLVDHSEDAVLSKQNCALTMVDQLATIAAPAITGLLLTRAGLTATSSIFMCLVALTWAGQAFCMRAISQRAIEVTKTRPQSCEGVLATYVRQRAFPAAFALAILYMTVLTFGGISMSYGKSQGLPEDILGIFRSVGAALGTVAAVAYTVMERRFGVVFVAFCGLLLEITCLSFCIASIWLPGSPFDPSSYFDESWFDRFLSSFDPVAPHGENNSTTVSPHVHGFNWSHWMIDGHPAISALFFYTGISLEKFGLRMSDLAINQIMQETVPEADRGTVFGVQHALTLMFMVAKDLLTIALPDPRTFGILILTSVAAVAASLIPYTYYVLANKIPFVRS
ncbi:CBN-FPN-1.2 protein [Aphelenchoides avenae]|nr:CBN-FPN-1.2 protein [Aphelenchus avenae]